MLGRLVILCGLLVVGSCSPQHKGSDDKPPSEAAVEAQRNVFIAAHEVFGLGYAKPTQVDFDYQLCRDRSDGSIDGHERYKAEIDASIKIIKPWSSKQVEEEYRKGLLRLPGWSNSSGGWYPYPFIITKGDLHIDLPSPWGGEENQKENMYSFSIEGSCTINQNMSEVDPDVARNQIGFPWHATDPQDYTEDFK